MIYYYPIFLFLFLFQGLIQTQHQGLDDYVQDFLQSEEFSYAGTSFSMIDIESGQMMIDHNSNMAMIPASSLKVLTTLTGCHYLGNDFQYITKLLYSGTLRDGVLSGNLYVKGVGDPSFGSNYHPDNMTFQEVLNHLMEEVRNAGIRKIKGEIIADESIFNSFPVSPSWQWNDLGNYYAAGAWGLNVLGNEYNITFKQSAKVGGPTSLLGYYPYIPNLKIQNEVTAGPKGSGDQAYIFGGPYEYKKRIVGTIPAGRDTFSIRGSIPDPPLFFAYHLKEKLAKNGISVSEYSSEYDRFKIPAQRKFIAEIVSLPYQSIAGYANEVSNNTFCEAILKTIGENQYREGAGSKGIRAVKSYLKELDIDTKGLRMDDGSGLSARNRFPSILMAQFLAKVAQNEGIDLIKDYLPKGGRKGTVKYLFANKPNMIGKVYLKSGSMENVQSYSGVLQGASGRWYSFCVMSNGHHVGNSKVRKKFEQLIVQMHSQG